MLCHSMASPLLCPPLLQNKSRFPPRLPPRLHGLPAPRPVTLLRRDGLLSPNEETVEALTEFLRCPDSPWALPPDCSPPEQQLRELAVQRPQIVRTGFVCCYFRSLRIVNKGVTEIDVGLLKFPNLEELILTANHISTIPAANLPPGNPFALLPAYRGFTIDSLPHISVFDDVIITPEERHNFLNLSTFPEALLTDVQLIVTLGKMRGVPNPFNPEDLESSPGSPIVTYSYYVTYEFAKGERKEKAAGKVRSLWDFVILSRPERWWLERQLNPCLLRLRPSQTCSLSREERRICSLDSLGSGTMVDRMGEKAGNRCWLNGSCFPSFLAYLANVHSTAKKGWAETIDCNYRKEHLSEDPVALKAYLLAGTSVTVVQEKVVSWPVIPTPEEKPGKRGKGAKGKADSGKKKKSLSPELRSDPPIVKTLGSSFHVSLEKVLAGASLVETVCNFGVQIIERNVTPPSPKDKGKKGAKKDPKAKSGTDSVNSKRTPPPPTPSPFKGKPQS
uniref:Leucine rich repeat containing 43 n=1 Tax=Naja naja TaxID=35670 RepID=A0A8C7E797_NAJNA